MANIWRKHPFRLLLCLEWILLGIALIGSFGGLIPQPRHHGVLYSSPWYSALGITCIAMLGFMGLKLPQNPKVIQQIYILGGFLLSWMATLSIDGGARISAVLFLTVVIRGCLLFSWRGRIFTAVLAYISFLAIQIMTLMRISPWGVSLGRPLPRALRRLSPDELQRVLFGLAFNSALLFAFVLAFVLLLVGAVLAEYKSRTKLIQANHRLREYALQIENQATLQERNRIAREIHDSVGHYLTAQSIQLENTAVFLAKDSLKAANHLAKARQLGKEALANIRASVATLRQNSAPKKSFAANIKKLISEFQSNTNIAVSSEIVLTPLLPNKVSTALYRIIQEALTNITKHSQATEVKIELKQTAEKITLSVRDNGRGFNKSNNTTGFGLQGIEERTKALEGILTINSNLSPGCQLVIEIPLPKPIG